jgi:hypothetical protein
MSTARSWSSCAFASGWPDARQARELARRCRCTHRLAVDLPFLRRGAQAARVAHAHAQRDGGLFVGIGHEGGDVVA